MSDATAKADKIELAAEIVSAYVSRNSVPAGELPALIQSVHGALSTIAQGALPEPEPEPLKPAVSIKKSIQDDFIICLEDGKRFKSLKRHLSSAYGMTPQDYRAKWGLAKDYPMVAPAYASQRSTLARKLGLGRKAASTPDAAPSVVMPEPESSPAKAAAKPTRRRSAKAAG